MGPDKFSIFKWFLIEGKPPRKRFCKATVLGKDHFRCFSRSWPTVMGGASISGSYGIIWVIFSDPCHWLFKQPINWKRHHLNPQIEAVSFPKMEWSSWTNFGLLRSKSCLAWIFCVADFFWLWKDICNSNSNQTNSIGLRKQIHTVNYFILSIQDRPQRSGCKKIWHTYTRSIKEGWNNYVIQTFTIHLNLWQGAKLWATNQTPRNTHGGRLTFNGKAFEIDLYMTHNWNKTVDEKTRQKYTYEWTTPSNDERHEYITCI